MVTSATSQHQLLITVSMESLCRYLQPASSQAQHPWIIHYTATSVWLVKMLSQSTNLSLKVDFARPHLSCHINLPFQFMNKQPISLSFLFMMYKATKLALESFSFLIPFCLCKPVSEKSRNRQNGCIFCAFQMLSACWIKIFWFIIETYWHKVREKRIMGDICMLW